MRILKLLSLYYGISLVSVRGYESNLRGDSEPNEDYDYNNRPLDLHVQTFYLRNFFINLVGLGDNPSLDEPNTEEIVFHERLENTNEQTTENAEELSRVGTFTGREPPESFSEDLAISGSNNDNAEAETMEAANDIFIKKIFFPLVRKKRIGSKMKIDGKETSDTAQIALSPAGIFFILALAENLLELPLYRYWSNIGSNIDLVDFNNVLVNDSTLVSKSVVAGEEWYQKVPADFEMENFKTFDSMDIKQIEEYLGVDVSEIANAQNAAVHYLQFSATWKTKFSNYEKVTFSDGIEYGFMKAKISNVPWYEDKNVQMVTIPFSDKSSNVVIDFIQSGKTSDFVDMRNHHEWVAASKTTTNAYVVIPKVDINFSTELDISRDPQIKSIQKVKVTWDEDGVKAEAVTMVMARSYVYTPWFIASRPFYFVIRKGSTWLFTGFVDAINRDLNPLRTE